LLRCRFATKADLKDTDMTNSKGRATRRLALAAPVLLLLLQAAQAQTAPAAESNPNTVVVNGVRGGGKDPTQIIAAKNKVMTRNRASSCNFMSPGNPSEEDITLRYMSDFGLEDSNSFDNVERFSTTSPGGDVSNATLSSSLDGLNDTPALETSPSVSCGASDRRFAAGRESIARKDKTLALGFEAFDNKDYPKALDLFKTAYSKVGYDEAGLMLGKMNLYGLGTKQDTNEAIRWLTKVANERFDPMRDRISFNPKNPHEMNERIEATFMLARIYERGVNGAARNPAEAKKWYAKAVDFGFVPALNLLGQAWLNGYGGEKSAPKALGYFKEAADAGYTTAQYNLAKLYYTGDDGVQRDLKMAGAYFEAAAKVKHPGALFAAGRMYDLGEGVPADQKKAIVYYKEAAVRGDRDSQFALGTFFYEGDVVAKDLSIARKLFDAAAKQGQVDAMFNLGAMEVNGEGGPKDLGMAYVWLSLAKAGGHGTAGDVLKAVTPKLTAQDQAKADAILKPKAKG
jgi:TPR repeat protein